MGAKSTVRHGVHIAKKCLQTSFLKCIRFFGDLMDLSRLKIKTAATMLTFKIQNDKEEDCQSEKKNSISIFLENQKKTLTPPAPFLPFANEFETISISLLN